MRQPPTLHHERAALAQGWARIAGVDEVGRGPLAGPVVAAAVVLGPHPPDGLDDSKRLTPRARAHLDRSLRDSAQVAVGWASVEEIEALNVGRATHLAMARALAGLERLPDLALIDGPHLPAGLPCAGLAIVGGDRLSLSVAAASIVAKVWRDALMVSLSQQHLGYGWETNRGYGTESHIRALQALGPTPHHRRTFAPVHKMLWQGPSGAD